MKESKLKIVALDPAGITGFCTNTKSGIWDVKPKPYESTGIKFLSLKKHLKTILEKEGIDLIAYEKPSGQHFTGVRSHANFEGVILEFCESNDIDYKAYTASEIKKFATGKGNAGKPLMIEAAVKKYGIAVTDDNHADALHLHSLATREFN